MDCSAALRDMDDEDMVPCINEIREKLVAAFLTKAAGPGSDCSRLLLAFENTQNILSWGVEYTPTEVVTKICTLRQAVLDTYNKWFNTKNKTNVQNFNKALGNFTNLPVAGYSRCDFGVKLKDESMTAFCDQYRAHALVAKECIDASETSLQVAYDEAAKICLGCLDGSSWKHTIQGDTSLADVLFIASEGERALLKGPGENAKAIKKGLTQAISG